MNTTIPTQATPEAAGVNRRPAFVTTHWSVVLTAGGNDTTDAHAALDSLCRAYWYPLYAYVRRRGHSPEDAQDLTQEFFARLLAKNWLASADQQRGRFRSFLLASLNHFLANEWDKARASKRGGGARITSLETATAETRFQREPSHEATPDKEYDRQWAVALLDVVLGRLSEEYRRAGKGSLFEKLKDTLGGERSSIPYAEIGRQAGMNEGAVKVAVHRLRQRYRVILRAEIANTVEGPEQVEEELRHLFAALAG